jgi:large subunit ribosomal protein L25
MGDTATVADLQVPDGVEIVDEPDEVLCSVLAPRKAEEEAGEAEELAEAAPVQPEVVGKAEKAEEAAEA